MLLPDGRSAEEALTALQRLSLKKGSYGGEKLPGKLESILWYLAGHHFIARKCL
jgi:hypothetical protein